MKSPLSYLFVGSGEVPAATARWQAAVTLAFAMGLQVLALLGIYLLKLDAVAVATLPMCAVVQVAGLSGLGRLLGRKAAGPQIWLGAARAVAGCSLLMCLGIWIEGNVSGSDEFLILVPLTFLVASFGWLVAATVYNWTQVLSVPPALAVPVAVFGASLLVVLSFFGWSLAFESHIEIDLLSLDV